MAADEGDKNTVLHVYNVDNLYAAVVEAYIQWQTALVEAVRRHDHALPRPRSLHPQAGESAAGRQSYRQGRKWRCECARRRLSDTRRRHREAINELRERFDATTEDEPAR